MDGRSGPKPTPYIRSYQAFSTKDRLYSQSEIFVCGEFSSLKKIRGLPRFSESPQNHISILGRTKITEGLTLFSIMKKKRKTKHAEDTHRHKHMSMQKLKFPGTLHKSYPSQFPEKALFEKVLDHKLFVLSFWRLVIDLCLERKFCDVRGMEAYLYL